VGTRRTARENAVQILFQLDLTAGTLESTLTDFWAEHDSPEDQRSFTERLVHGVRQSSAEIDRWISGSARRWRLERMPVVDRNVLRLGIWELLFEPDTPPAVVLDEAIAVAKKYGSGESGSFVNGVLDDVRQRIEAQRDRQAPGEISPPS